jgi:hypothetical protein
MKIIGVRRRSIRPSVDRTLFPSRSVANWREISRFEGILIGWREKGKMI